MRKVAGVVALFYDIPLKCNFERVSLPQIRDAATRKVLTIRRRLRCVTQSQLLRAYIRYIHFSNYFLPPRHCEYVWWLCRCCANPSRIASLAWRVRMFFRSIDNIQLIFPLSDFTLPYLSTRQLINIFSKVFRKVFERFCANRNKNQKDKLKTSLVVSEIISIKKKTNFY